MALGSTDKLAHLVLKRGLCTQEQMRDALKAVRVAQSVGARTQLAEILLEKGYVTPEQMQDLRNSLAHDGVKRTVAGYELLESVGKGGMGDVYRARQKSLNRIVAIKLLSSALAADQTFIQRFQREARLAAKLNHPNLVQVYDVGEDRGQYYLAMEFVEGVSVADILKREGRLPEARVVALAKDIAKALEVAEAQGVVHRDVKPSNVLISESGLAKLTDMGLAKETHSEDPHITRTGTSLGTPNYMSPEQCMGRRDLDTRSDIYSLGASLYHMLTGRTPFEAATTFEMLRKHVDEPVTPPRRLQPDLSPQVEAIVMKMMAKAPEDRYQSAGEVREALDAMDRSRGAAVSAVAAGRAGSGGGVRGDAGDAVGWLLRLAAVMLVFAVLGAAGAVLLPRLRSAGAKPGGTVEGLSPRPAFYLPESVQRRVAAECVSVWGASGHRDGQFQEPAGIAVGGDGTVFVADRWNHRVQLFRPDGVFVGVWPQGWKDRLFAPSAVLVASDGRLFVADAGQGRIVVLDSTGRFIASAGHVGPELGELLRPMGMALLPSGGLAVTEEKADRCQVFWPDGRVSGDPQARALAQSWDGPWGAALGPNGDLAVADSRRGRIVCLASGLDMPRWTVSLTAESRPAGLAWDSQGRLYATDVRHHRLYVVQDGALVGAWGAPGAERGRFCRPEGVAVGPAGDIYVTDTGNDRIQQFRLTIPSQGIVMEGERSAH